jgi:hypothetical protein
MPSTPKAAPRLFATLRENWRDFVPMCVLMGSLPLVEPVTGIGMARPPLLFYLLLAPFLVYSMLRAGRSYHNDEAPQWHTFAGVLLLCFPSFALSAAAVAAFGSRA